jgi:hypothetical protein
VDLHLRGTMVMSQALPHLYVLLPVLDNAKHYWVTTDEVDKLVRAGSGWLQQHPERDLIARRYLAHQKDLVISGEPLWRVHGPVFAVLALESEPVDPRL